MATAAGFTESDLLDQLAVRFSAPACGFLRHVPDGTAGNKNATIDGLAMELWPSRGYSLYAFEVKVSRYDWLRELKKPQKADRIAQLVDVFYVVAPDGVVQMPELPRTWGLITFHQTAKTRTLSFHPPIQKLQTKPIDRAFLASLFRKIEKHAYSDADVTRQIETARQQGHADGQRTAVPALGRLQHAYDQLRDRVDTFETASGITIDGYRDLHAIGAAVKELVELGPDRLRDLLMQQARELIRVQESIGRALEEITHANVRRTDVRSDSQHGRDDSQGSSAVASGQT
jgi:hypothetical protein